MACQLRDNGFTKAEAERAAEIYAGSVSDRTYARGEALSSVRSAYRRPIEQETTHGGNTR